MTVGTETKVHLVETIRFYMTALAVLIACFSSFAFLFLVPFVIDPAFSTLFAEYSEQPAACVTVTAEYKKGISNCTWSSCREGCTTEMYHCSQVYVNYRADGLDFFEGREYIEPYSINNIKWDFTEAKLFPNVKGCGYPPDVNCTAFDEAYSVVGSIYPCFHSNITPDTVLTKLDIHQVKLDLFYAIGVPWSLFLGSILYLLLTYAGMNKPNTKENEIQEVQSPKASKNASNYSLRSIGKTLNEGPNKCKGDQKDDKGEFRKKFFSSALTHRRRKSNKQ